MSITKGIIHNGIANITQRAIRILDQLILVPFFLTAWGAEYYGEWLTLSIIPSILAFSDLGFGSAVCNGFVLAYASGNKQQAANLYKSGIWVISTTILLGTILTATIVMTGYYAGWFAKSVITASDAMLAVTIMMTSKLILFYTQLAEGFYRGARRAAIGSFLASGNSLLNIIVGITILKAGYGVISLALSNLIIAVSYTALYWIIGRRMISFDGLKGKMERKDIRMITAKGLGYLATPIWQSVYFQGTTFVVRIAVDFSIIIGFIGSCTLCVIGLNLYNWWTQNALPVDKTVWNIFMIGVFMNAVWWTSVISYRMTNQPKHFAIASTSMACFSVLVCYTTSKVWGFNGAALATTLFETIMAIYILPDSCKLLRMKVTNLFKFQDDYHILLGKIKQHN